LRPAFPVDFARSCRHLGTGPGNRSRRIRSRIARNNPRGMATSAIWKITYRAVETTLAPILINFSQGVVKDQCLMVLGRASLHRKLPRLYAKANSCSL